MNLRRVLVATDFSDAGEQAIAHAASLARQHGAELRLLHATPPRRWLEGLFSSRDDWTQQVRKRAVHEIRQRIETLAAEDKIELSTALIEGKASAAIHSAIRQYRPDLLVIGAQGESARTKHHDGLGGTAEKLLRTCPIPLLLARHDPDVQQRVLALLDLGSDSKRVVRWGLALGRSSRCVALHVFDAPFADRLRSYGITRKTIDVYTGDLHAERDRTLRKLLSDADMSRSVQPLILRGEPEKVTAVQLRKLKIHTLVINRNAYRSRSDATPCSSVCHDLAYFSSVNVLVVP